MAFRRSIPQEELRAALSKEELDRHATTYQASRGGHFEEPEKPVPGTPKSARKS
jgi:hypothetical protein